MYHHLLIQTSSGEKVCSCRQALRAEDILNLQFRDGSSSRFLVDAELTALSAQLVPALNALTEAELYTQRGYGDSAYYTLAVNLRDGKQYTFLCGFDRVRLLHPTFEPALSSSYPSDRQTLWIDSPALMACIDSLEASPAPLPDFETVDPTPLADILPAREPWMTIPLAGKVQRIEDLRISSDDLDYLTQMDMDSDGVCEIVSSSFNFPAIYYKHGGQLYGVNLKSVITAAWPELNGWGYTSSAPASRSVLFVGLSAGDAPSDGVTFMRYVYFDGENLLLYKLDRSHTDHVADATLADPSIPAEIVARAKQLVQRRYNTLVDSAAQYDDWYTGCLPRKIASFLLDLVLFGAIRSDKFPLFPASPVHSNPILGQKWVKENFAITNSEFAFYLLVYKTALFLQSKYQTCQ